jgi:hypothetical protein
MAWKYRHDIVIQKSSTAALSLSNNAFHALFVFIAENESTARRHRFCGRSCGLFTADVSTSEHTTANDDYWILKWKERWRKSSSITEVLTRHFLRGTGWKHGGPVRIAGVPGEIRTEHLPNTSLDRYRYSNPLTEVVVSVCLSVCTSLLHHHTISMTFATTSSPKGTWTTSW